MIFESNSVPSPHENCRHIERHKKQERDRDLLGPLKFFCKKSEELKEEKRAVAHDDKPMSERHRYSSGDFDPRIAE